MAWLTRPEDVIEARIALLGTQPARDTFWEHLQNHLGEEPPHDALVFAAGRCAGRPLRLIVERVQPRGTLPIVMDLARHLTGCDGALVVLDDVGQIEPSRHALLRQVETALALLEHPLPRFLVGLDWRSEGMRWPRFLRTWGERSDWTGEHLSDAPRSSDVERVLGHFAQAVQRRAEQVPPEPTTLNPREDLAASLRDEGERLLETVRTSLHGIERASARLRLAQLYRRAGRGLSAARLRASALNIERSETLWAELERAPGGLAETQCLRHWEIPPSGVPHDLVWTPDRCGLIVSTSQRLLHVRRDSSTLEVLDDTGGWSWWRLEPWDLAHVAMLSPSGLGLLRLADGELRRARLPASLRQVMRQVARRPQLRTQLDTGRLLVVTEGGLWLFGDDFLLESRLDRDDIVTAELDAQGNVWTVHAGGTLGRWRPGSPLLDQVATVSGRIRHASIAVTPHATLAAVVAERPGTQRVLLQLFDLSNGRQAGTMDTAQATYVSLAPDARRVMTLEHEIPRLRQIEAGLDETTPTRSLIEVAPWLSRSLAWSGGRFLGLLSRTPSEEEPFRVMILG